MTTENYHLKQFSPDNKLFAIIQSDGKLKIWDVEKSELKQEYVPNLHLSTPCTALSWIKLSTKQKKKSKSTESSSGDLHVILGTNKGGLALYSYSTAKIETTFTGDGHSAPITSIDHDSSNFIYTAGLDGKVIKWSIKNCKQESTIDCGPERPTSICLLEDHRIAVAAKSIKIYNIKDSTLVQTCTGHSSNILLMKTFEHDDDEYVLSASKNDRNLSLWKLQDDQKKTSALATFSLLNNSPSSLGVRLVDDTLQIVCVCRNDSMSFFEINLNSMKSKKPVKTKFTLEIATESEKNVSHIPVTAVNFANEEQLMIGYGDFIVKFEMISLQQDQKNVILVRTDPMKMRVAKKSKDGDDDRSALITPIVSKDAEVLSSLSAKRKQKPVEIALETRLDNLTVGEGRKPNAKKMTHQLIQGLHGKDANILRTVLRTKDEETVRMTVKFLPSQYVIALVNELSILMTKRTAGSEVALVWLRYLIQTHSSSLMAYGIENLNATFGTTLGIIDHRAESFPKLQRLRGRLELLVRQIKQTDDVGDEMKMDNLLVYEDSEDDSIHLDDSNSSDSETFDEEDDEDEPKAKQNGKSVEKMEQDSEDENMLTSDGSD